MIFKLRERERENLFKSAKENNYISYSSSIERGRKRCYKENYRQKKKKKRKRIHENLQLSKERVTNDWNLQSEGKNSNEMNGKENTHLALLSLFNSNIF